MRTFCKHAGGTIHYEVLGDGPPLFLHHGMTQSLERWHLDGYVDALKDRFQLILLDARGHGQSEKFYEPSAYGLDNYVADVLAILDELKLQQVRYWGFSLGAGVGFALANRAPERVCAFILGGGHPYARTLSAEQRPDGSDADAFARIFMQRLGVDLSSIPATHLERLMNNDFRALAAAQQDRPSQEGALAKMSMPCLIYAGESDPLYAEAEQSASAINHASFISLAGLDHTATFRESGRILPRALAFLETTVNG
ncbi:MAG: alpha/beta fold hydrolase [Gammaproteobacteria bacterium]|nr:alpha/beta fold hydrolase [Gammaproteobacteria bacterium]